MDHTEHSAAQTLCTHTHREKFEHLFTDSGVCHQTVFQFAPERRAAVDQCNGFGHVSVLVVSKHAALHAFMKHLDFTLETKTRASQTSIKIILTSTAVRRLVNLLLPVQEVGKAIEAALSHPRAQTAVDGGRTFQIHLQPLQRQTHSKYTNH